MAVCCKNTKQLRERLAEETSVTGVMGEDISEFVASDHWPHIVYRRGARHCYRTGHARAGHSAVSEDEFVSIVKGHCPKKDEELDMGMIRTRVSKELLRELEEVTNVKWRSGRWPTKFAPTDPYILYANGALIGTDCEDLGRYVTPAKFVSIVHEHCPLRETTVPADVETDKTGEVKGWVSVTPSEVKESMQRMWNERWCGPTPSDLMADMHRIYADVTAGGRMSSGQVVLPRPINFKVTGTWTISDEPGARASHDEILLLL